MAFYFTKTRFNFNSSFYFLFISFRYEHRRNKGICPVAENVSESFPFGNETLVFKAGNKIFLLTSLNSEVLQFNVKCDPEYAVELREQYPSIVPGYHMNKRHWNTIIVDGTLSAKQLKQFIKDSYLLVGGK